MVVTMEWWEQLSAGGGCRGDWDLCHHPIFTTALPPRSFTLKNTPHILYSSPMKPLAAILLTALALLVGACGEEQGACNLTCHGQSGNVYRHGPYENYTATECNELAETSSTPLAPCSAEWEP